MFIVYYLLFVVAEFYCFLFITMFGLLYRFFAFIVLFEERCLVVYKGNKQGGGVSEAGKCLGEMVDGYSLQI